MGCNCGERRALTAQAFQNLKQGKVAEAKQNAQRFAQTVRVDAQRAQAAMRSALTRRPR